MSIKDTIHKAYGSIPKEVGLNISSWDGVPTFRGIRYYWKVLVRKFRKLG
jgi:hypothetical protein